MTEWTEDVARLVTRLHGASVDDLTDWLRDRLAGVDDVGANGGEPPHFLIATLFDALDHSICSNLQKAVHFLIEELAEQNATWSDAAAAELLMLSDPVLINTSRRPDLIEMLSCLARPTKDAKVSPAIRFAAAQALVTLDVKAAPEFWFSLYEEGKDEYAPIVVEGLVRTDMTALADWLGGKLPNAALELALINLLPFMIDRYGSGIATQMVGSLDVMSRQSREELRILLNVIGAGSGEVGLESSIELVRALSGGLHLVAQLLLQAVSAEIGDKVPHAFETNLMSVRLIAQHQAELGIAANLEELWAIYVDCIDQAFAHSRLAQACLKEIVAVLPALLVDKLAVHLVSDRGYTREQITEMLNNAGFEASEALARVESVTFSTYEMRFPVELRDEMTTELWLQKEQKDARETFLANTEDSPANDSEWRGFMNEYLKG